MISVIIPVFNGEKTIKRCLDSIIKNIKKEENIEIIVINDGSTDNTLKICKELQNNNNCIRVFSKENGGVSSARQYGIEKASGDWIMFVDADDYLSDNFCSRNIKKEDDWIIFTDIVKENIEIEKNNDFMYGILNKSKKNLFNQIHLNTVWSKMYRKSIILDNNIRFNEDLIHGEDMIFNMDYYKNCEKVKIIKNGIYSLCKNNNSTTHRFQIGIVENDIIFLNKLKKYNIDKKIYNELILNGLFVCLNQYYFHSNNTKKFNKVKEELDEIKNQSPYHDALNEYSKLNISNIKKIVFFCLKHNYYSILYLMFKVKNTRNKEKNEEIQI